MIVFLVPVLDVLRYDSATQELIFFGKTWSLGLKEGFYADQGFPGATHVALHFLLNAILPWVVILSIFPLFGFFFGRFFCGWFCPDGALFEWADYLNHKILGRRNLYSRRASDPPAGTGKKLPAIILALLSVIVIPFFAGVALTGYFVSPPTVWHQIFTGEFTFGVKAGIIGVAIYVLIGSIFVRHAFCKYICAAGFMQTLFGWVSPVSLRLKLDALRMTECTDCKGCDQACFMNVLPRKNKRDISCVNCGACIDACNRELKGRGLFCLSRGDNACHSPKISSAKNPLSPCTAATEKSFPCR